jgi:hypothetical protein
MSSTSKSLFICSSTFPRKTPAGNPARACDYAAAVFGGEPDHVKGLCRRRAAAPNRVNGRRLVGHVSPALARQLAKFREPIGEGLVLPPRDVFCQNVGATYQSLRTG